jgi:hypothetical protein
MIFRIAKLSDLKTIVDLHYKVRDTYNVGVFQQMGKPFLNEYYRTVLNDPYELVVCAEDQTGRIHGFCSATLDVKKQMVRLRSKKWRFGLAAITSFLRDPSLIKEIWTRYKSTDEKSDMNYVPTDGVRGEYWTWDATSDKGLYNAVMYEAHLKILYALGVKKYYIEVDDINEKVARFHLANKAVSYHKETLPDGRVRTMYIYDLIKRYKKN